MNTNWTDQDIDNLIASVEETLEKAEVLAKSASLKKEEEQKEQAQDEAMAAPAQDAAPVDQAPAEAAPAEEQAAPAAEEQAAADQAPADQQAAPEQGEQALESEEDAPLNDEELQQIYSSMAPEELERHYSIIRQALQASYGEQAPEEQQAAPAEAAPAEAAPAAPEMEKSEKVMELEKKIAEQAQAIEQITKAFEVLAKPSRKSITDIQVMAKSEADSGQNGPMTQDEIKSKAGKLSPASLSKSERDLVNRFFLHGEGQQEVEKLINSKGGK